MQSFFDINWHEILSFDVPMFEIFVRGSLIYLALFLLLRVILKRQSGNLAITDVLVIVLIADASQNGMAGDYKSVPDGIFLVATILFWDYILDLLAYHVKWFANLIYQDPLPLIKNGELIVKNMRHELVTREELMSQLRENEVMNISDVKIAYLEGNGNISVIKYDKN